jgi:CAAX protease family protein
MNSTVNNNSFFKMACIFEGALVLVAVVLGWIAGINPFAEIHFSESAVAYGLMGTVPLLLILQILYQFQFESIREIHRILNDTLGSTLHRYHWTDLFVLAAIAGIGEEILFRGVIQPWMEASWGMMAGLIGSNIIFGLVHAVTPLYAVLAGLVGVYIGIFLDVGEQRNLLTPIVIHGVYDFLAFIIILRSYRKSLS